MDKDLASSTMNFIVQIGVIGSIALMLAAGLLVIAYRLGVRMVDGILERFTPLDLRMKSVEDKTDKMLQEQITHTLLLKSVSENQDQITQRLSSICHAKR